MRNVGDPGTHPPTARQTDARPPAASRNRVRYHTGQTYDEVNSKCVRFGSNVRPRFTSGLAVGVSGARRRYVARNMENWHLEIETLLRRHRGHRRCAGGPAALARGARAPSPVPTRRCARTPRNPARAAPSCSPAGPFTSQPGARWALGGRMGGAIGRGSGRRSLAIDPLPACSNAPTLAMAG